jgi:molybdate transport system ATP-binding protein
VRFEVDIHTRLGRGRHAFTLRSAFSVEENALVLFGPSGSGKTLTLQAIAGLLRPDAGRIVVDGRVLFDAAAGVDVPARRRGVGYVFQDYALFPHRTVRQNVGFGLSDLLGRLSPAHRGRVDELIHIFGLEPVAGQRPAHLSGGQRQRTALARALAPRPSLLLLDEPFSALDQPLRLRMRRELAKVLENFRVPMVMVTHDTDEVESLAQSVVVYNRGSVVGVHRAAALTAAGGSVAETLRDQVALAYGGDAAADGPVQ